MRNLKFFLLLLAFTTLSIFELKAQNVRLDIIKARTLVGEGKYADSYSILQKITDAQAEAMGDTSFVLYNYSKGTSLYFQKRYEEAIPFLQKGIQIMDRIRYKNCDYFEMLYGIGSCYRDLGNLQKAEEYYRRVILRGNDFVNCAIRSQTYGDLAELYTKMGKPEFAEICASRIEYEMKYTDPNDLKAQIQDLYDLYDAYDKQGKIEESIRTLKKLLKLIEDTKGKVNDDYLLYSNLLGIECYTNNRKEEAANTFKEIIEIGKAYRAYNKNVLNAYVRYLSYLAESNKVDSIEIILPSAVKYYKSASNETRVENNLYEIVGNGLCDANNIEEGIKYLERKWEGGTANSIRALTYLGEYYFDKNPEKALSFFNNAEKQIDNGIETNDITQKYIYTSSMFLNENVGNFQEAVKYAALAEPLVRKLDDNNIYLQLLTIWAVYCVHATNIEKAKELVNKAIPYIDQADDNSKIYAYTNIGFVYIKSDEGNTAIPFIKKGIDLIIKTVGERTPRLATPYHNLGRAYMLEKDYVQALIALNKSKDLQIEFEGKVWQKTKDYIKECEAK